MREPSPTPPVALTIAGSDSSGGAGMQADLATFFALGVHGASAISALTAQNSLGVTGVLTVEPAFLALQIAAVCDDLRVRAVKTGMLASGALIESVAVALRFHHLSEVVVDPVMVAKSGAVLLQDQALDALRTQLLPLARVLTPNLPEAARLLDWPELEVRASPEAACRALLAMGPRSVVLKGGHAGGTWSEDLFFDGVRLERLGGKRIDSRNTHGTGCTFSAALCAHLALGSEPLAAAQAAKRYIQAAIEGAREWQLGSGHGPVDHWLR